MRKTLPKKPTAPNREHLLRYQANCQAKSFWRLIHSRARWQKQRGNEEGDCYLAVKIPSCPALRIKRSTMRLYHADYLCASKGFSQAEILAWESYLLRPRHNCLFFLSRSKGTLRRNPRTGDELEAVVYKLVHHLEPAPNPTPLAHRNRKELTT